MIDIAFLAQMGPCKKFDAGQRIPCPGSSGSSEREMYVLVSGMVDVYRKSAAGGTKTTASLLPGDVFGGREYFTDAEDCIYSAGADSIVYAISKKTFEELSWTKPEILFEVLRAAYVPMRKISASQKNAMLSDPRSNADNAKAVRIPSSKTVAAPTLKTRAAGQIKAEGSNTGQQAKAGEQIKAPGQDGILPAMYGNAAAEGIFPEGHKLYPGITKPEYSRLVFQKEYNCPFCKKPFTDYKIFRSKLYESAPPRYDLRRFFADFQTEWYDVITCPNCLFSTLHNYYTEPKPIQKTLIESKLAGARASILLDFEAERDIDFVLTAHYLAIACSDGYLSAGKQIRAKLWGNLSWLYEDVGDEKMAKFASGKAAQAYETVYAETLLTPIQEQITCLSIAGMQFRAGVDNNLKKFLFTAKTAEQGDRSYAKLAEDFLYDLRLDGDK